MSKYCGHTSNLDQWETSSTLALNSREVRGGDENNDTEYSNIDRMSLYKNTLCPLHSYTFVVWSTTLRSDGEPQAGGGIPWILCRHQCRVSSSQNTRATISKSTVTNKEYPGKILTVWRIWKRTQGGCAQLRWIKLFKSSLVVLKQTGSRLGL